VMKERVKERVMKKGVMEERVMMKGVKNGVKGVYFDGCHRNSQALTGTVLTPSTLRVTIVSSILLKIFFTLKI
jgi:hypothetical protein